MDAPPAGGGLQLATLWALEVTTDPTGSTPPMWNTPNAINAAANSSIAAGSWTPLVRMQPPGSAVLQDQLDLVAGYADMRADRAREIVALRPRNMHSGVRSFRSIRRATGGRWKS